MRKTFFLLAGVTIAAFLAGSPAQAATGCGCVKLGSSPMCVSGISSCMSMGGVCLAPCDYMEPKKAMRKHKKKKKA
jgi:hypothetical protein